MTDVCRSWRRSWVLAAALAVLVSGTPVRAETQARPQAHAAWQGERDLGSAAFYDHIGKTLRKRLMPEAAQCQSRVKTVAVDRQTRARWWVGRGVKRACGTPGR